MVRYLDAPRDIETRLVDLRLDVRTASAGYRRQRIKFARLARARSIPCTRVHIRVSDRVGSYSRQPSRERARACPMTGKTMTVESLRGARTAWNFGARHRAVIVRATRNSPPRNASSARRPTDLDPRHPLSSPARAPSAISANDRPRATLSPKADRMTRASSGEEGAVECGERRSRERMTRSRFTYALSSSSSSTRKRERRKENRGAYDRSLRQSPILPGFSFVLRPVGTTRRHARTHACASYAVGHPRDSSRAEPCGARKREQAVGDILRESDTRLHPFPNARACVWVTQ